ncbi:phosphoribosylaminoimidazolesuccinocarboxamide synthase [Aneurinibacillus sp. Ricciae_BoGa-3]|uniref:phosphoribosylaminoimidazolesuccinocarboxamide synthase n=1 Tax=Aneurinibacillus sp. Ricciae_BoGa-3 TaxID=3022697 RepID=UPI002341CFDF|nr:phosphoribosylaminoimidazolesuccinocarboxamide synthase [Aneurinibacillus sp. Ricciae_BoGa-3]WCK54866.1 phosphoribosylaminoimidazolesuccinocarboxamide synthase [Aneurinibacillus sp. Ricciae_BoGa-3]
MEKREQLYEGKAKKVYRTSEPGFFWLEYKDDATAFNGAKKAEITGKGALNNQISAIFLSLLKQKGIENHFVKTVSDTEQIVREVTIVPLEVVTRNIAAGSLAKRLGWEEGTPLSKPIVEWYYKNDELGDPILNDDHVAVLNIAVREELNHIKEISLRVNDVLKEYLAGRKVILVDFKLEFGKTPEGQLILADEISPDTCRFWDANTMEKLDKDRFRRDLGNVEEAYREILRRLGGQENV